MITTIPKHFTYKSLISFMLPTIAAMSIITSFTLIDSFFISNFLGKEALAAVNMVIPIIVIVSGFGIMFGAGGSAHLAVQLGRGNKHKASEVLSMLIALLIFLGIIFGVFLYFTIPSIMKFIGATEELMDGCVEYGRIAAVFMAFFFIDCAFISLWPAVQKPELGFILALVDGVIKLAADILLIVIFPFGITGAAFATVLGMAGNSIIALIYFSRENKTGLRFVRFKIEWKVLGQMCYNGLSEMVDSISSCITSVFFNYQLMHFFGDTGVAAFAVFSCIFSLLNAVFFGIAASTVSIAGFYYGSKNFNELKHLIKKNTTICIGFGLFIAMICFLFAGAIADIYVGYDRELRDMAALVLKISSFSFIFYGFNAFSSSFYTGLENGFISALIAFLHSLLFPSVMVFLLPALFGPDSIWFSIPVATFSTLIFTSYLMIHFYSGKYKKMNADIQNEHLLAL